MVVTRYYRHYLWIFFYFSFFLMATAIAFDIKAEASGGAGGAGGSDKNLIRFLNVLFCFIFSCIALTMQNYASRSMMGVNTLMFDRKKWLKRYVRLKRRRLVKVTRKHHLVSLMFINAFSNFVNLIPIYIIGILVICNVWSNVESKIFKKEFFCVAILGKYIAWYLTLLISRFSIFFGKKRLHVMV